MEAASGLVQPRPRLGLRPWLALLRLARRRALAVRLDMADHARRSALCPGRSRPAPAAGPAAEAGADQPGDNNGEGEQRPVPAPETGAGQNPQRTAQAVVDGGTGPTKADVCGGPPGADITGGDEYDRAPDRVPPGGEGPDGNLAAARP